MNGAQDLGGMMGFGPVRPEANEPTFHADWERRAFAITLAMGATASWNLDMSRAMRESLPPPLYLAASYYEIWLLGLAKLLAERNLVTANDRAAGRAVDPPMPIARVLRAADVDAVLARGASTERSAPAPALFAVGARVRARNMHPVGHTRLPRYVRGRIGTIAQVHGVHVFPDTHAGGEGEHPQWVYAVAFPARELWGEAADPTVSVSVDCWESYLEPAA